MIMTHEDEMRNNPVYKILQHLMDKRSKLPQICEKEGDFAVDQFINELDWLIDDEAPEIYRLFQYDNRLLEAPNCSPAGEPNPPEEDQRMSYSLSRSVMAPPDDFWPGYDNREKDIQEEPEFGPGDGIVYSIVKDREKAKGFECLNCSAKVKDGDGPLCPSCEEKGIWIDPAGGIHTDDEDDPAAMYE